MGEIHADLTVDTEFVEEIVDSTHLPVAMSTMTS